MIVGADNPKALEKIKELYMPFTKSHERFISMDVRSAEMTKYAANAMLAAKISFMNEIANICERVGADVNKGQGRHRKRQQNRIQLYISGLRIRRKLFPKGRKGAGKISNRK